MNSNRKNTYRLRRFSVLAIPALCVAALTGCNSEVSGASAADAPASINSASSSPTKTSTPAPAPTSAPASSVVGDSCVSGDASKLCMAVHFVSYQDSSGTPVADTEQAISIINSMNRLWSQCGIAFQIEKYEAVDPAQYGLAYGAQSQNQTQQIRTTFAQPANQLLAVTTGPWGTAVNAWTNMPGEGTYGAIMEASIVNYGNGIIYAHEFGHYLGLDHIGDTSNLMDAIIYTSSTVINSSQCQTARSTASTFWSAMLRK